MLWIVSLGASLLTPVTDCFETPFRVQAAGEYINVDNCHAAPVYEDIDGDGIKELLVGQHKDGKIRLYRNRGTNAAPVFKEFTWLEADGKEIAVGST